LPVEVADVREAEVELVEQDGGLEVHVGAVGAEEGGAEAAEFEIDGVKQGGKGGGVAGAPLLEILSDLGGFGMI
jgi:hypothetical protein